MKRNLKYINKKLKNSKKITKKNINNKIYIEKYNETVDDKYIEFGKTFEDKNLIYEGFLKDNKYHGIGIEYFSYGNRKRKAKYENGNIKNCYGILYNDKNEQEYIGLLLEGRPKEGKSIKYYGEKDFLIYIGDFYDYKYNGNGILYYEDGKNILYNGIFKDDNYDNGILYYIDGKKNMRVILKIINMMEKELYFIKRIIVYFIWEVLRMDILIMVYYMIHQIIKYLKENMKIIFLKKEKI